MKTRSSANEKEDLVLLGGAWGDATGPSIEAHGEAQIKLKQLCLQIPGPRGSERVTKQQLQDLVSLGIACKIIQEKYTDDENLERMRMHIQRVQDDELHKGIGW